MLSAKATRLPGVGWRVDPRCPHCGHPYLIVGVIWSSTHTEHLQHMDGIDLVVSYLGSIVSWPVLLFANVCMT